VIFASKASEGGISRFIFCICEEFKYISFMNLMVEVRNGMDALFSIEFQGSEKIVKMENSISRLS
jgi:hypothetical protein